MLTYQKAVTVAEILHSSQSHKSLDSTSKTRYPHDKAGCEDKNWKAGEQPRDEVTDIENNRKLTINERQEQLKERGRH